MKICSAWPTSPSLWCPTPTLVTTSMVRLWKMFCYGVLEGKQSFKIYGFHNGGNFLLGKSAHGAADTDMAGLLGQLQVIMPWHWPIINTVPKFLIIENSTSGKRTIFAATEVSLPAPTTRPLPWAFHTSWEPTMTRLTLIVSLSLILSLTFSLFSCKVTCISYICTFNTQVVTPAAGTRGSQSRPRLTGTVLENVVAAYSTMNRYRLLKNLR